MSAVWTRLRHLVTSMMLVAVASLVLHGGAMAGLHQHGQGSIECATTGSGGHVHQAEAHDHATPDDQHVTHDHEVSVGHYYAAANLDKNEVPSDQHAAGESSACCASVCAVALIALGLSTTSAPMSSSLTLVPSSHRGSGIDPNGLKRPPRTPSIA